MEFIEYQEALKQLTLLGIRECRSDSSAYKRFEFAGKTEPHRIALQVSGLQNHAADGAARLSTSKPKFASLIEQVFHSLRLHDVILIPFAPWRGIFDTVAFSLAENKSWQQVDALASVELNSHDPLQFDCGNFQTLTLLLNALIADGSTNAHSVTIATLRSPFLIEFDPEGSATISVHSAPIANELVAELSERA